MACGVRWTGIQILALPRSQGKLLCLSVPQFPHLHGDNKLPTSHDYCEAHVQHAQAFNKMPGLLVPIIRYTVSPVWVQLFSLIEIVGTA